MQRYIFFSVVVYFYVLLQPILMNRTFKNRIAWLLLAAYLPMLVASVLHVHHLPGAEDVACYDCVHHISHPAHFGEYHPAEQSCLYCHLLSLPNLALALAVGIAVLTAAVRLCVPPVTTVASCYRGLLRLRAPPVRL